MYDVRSSFEVGHPPPVQPGGFRLAPGDLAAAVQANRTHARQLGWGCLIGGRVHAPVVIRFLMTSARALVEDLLGGPATEEALAHAVARWQRTELRRPATGRLDARTWNEMVRRGAIPRPTYEQRTWRVIYRGAQLGVLDKTAPYLKLETPAFGGASLDIGFRATNMHAVRRAGFVTTAGEPFFRWIQTVEFIRQVTPGVDTPLAPGAVRRFIRRAGIQVDPTRRTTPTVLQDAFPYYWDEVVMPAPSGDQFLVTRFMNTEAPNGLCYDLLFVDRPRVGLPGLVADLPGRRDYNNYELALVGVRPPKPGKQTQNVILNTIRWGYDIVFERGAPRVRLNSLQTGPFGGSPALRAVLAADARAGRYPGHCFVGDFPRHARCP
jgi:hypothetical protein